MITYEDILRLEERRIRIRLSQLRLIKYMPGAYIVVNGLDIVVWIGRLDKSNTRFPVGPIGWKL